MLYRKEANSRDLKSNTEKRGGGSSVEMRREICLKYSNMTKCLNTFVAHCGSDIIKLTMGLSDIFVFYLGAQYIEGALLVYIIIVPILFG